MFIMNVLKSSEGESIVERLDPTQLKKLESAKDTRKALRTKYGIKIQPWCSGSSFTYWRSVLSFLSFFFCSREKVWNFSELPLAVVARGSIDMVAQIPKTFLFHPRFRLLLFFSRNRGPNLFVFLSEIMCWVLKVFANLCHEVFWMEGAVSEWIFSDILRWFMTEQRAFDLPSLPGFASIPVAIANFGRCGRWAVGNDGYKVKQTGSGLPVRCWICLPWDICTER